MINRTITFRKFISPEIPLSGEGQKYSTIDSDEVLYSGANSYNGGQTYPEKLSVQGLNFTQMEMMYKANVWVRAIVDKIKDRVADVPLVVKPINTLNDANTKESKLSDETKKDIATVQEFMVMPNDNYESFTTLRKKLDLDESIFDAGALETVKELSISKDSKTKIQLYSVPGNTVKINVDNLGLFKSDKDAYIQVDRYMKQVTAWPKEKLIYFMLNPSSRRVYGLSPLESLVQTVTAELNTAQYNIDFYGNNATPRFAILIDGMGLGQGNPGIKRFREWWDNELRGNPHRPIIVGTEQGKIQFEKVGLTNEEMQFQEYSKWLLLKIMVIYKMQPAILGIEFGTTSKSGVEEQVKQFKIDVLKPRLSYFRDQINHRVIFSNSGFGIKTCYIDCDLDIVDKANQATWHQIYLQTGVITINEIRTQALGLSPAPWGDVPYLQNNIAPFGQGPNGQSVPGNPANVNLNPATGEQISAPNASIMSRSLVEKYICQDTGLPIGWEHIEPSERLRLVEKIIDQRRKELSTVYSI